MFKAMGKKNRQFYSQMFYLAGPMIYSPVTWYLETAIDVQIIFCIISLTVRGK